MLQRLRPMSAATPAQLAAMLASADSQDLWHDRAGFRSPAAAEGLLWPMTIEWMRGQLEVDWHVL